MATQLEFSRGDVIAQKYEVVDQLDHSPLGMTYRVKELAAGQYVQLTMLDERIGGTENRNSVQDRFRAASALEHPHLCRPIELGEHEGRFFYTFEDFEGTSLRELILDYRMNHKSFSVKEASQICLQVLEGLMAMHAAGHVFRCLRPEYVLVNARWTGPRQQTFVAKTKIVGAGMWGLIPTQVLAEDEFTRGESQYLAPELKGFDPVPTPRCDVYSAGVILYELLVGAPPVGTFQLPKSHRPDLQDHINDVVELAIAYAPEDRLSFAAGLRSRPPTNVSGCEPRQRRTVTTAHHPPQLGPGPRARVLCRDHPVLAAARPGPRQ